MAWWRKTTADAGQVSQRSTGVVDFPLSNPAIAALLGYQNITAPSVNADTALTLSAWYRGVMIVSGSIASLPLSAVEHMPDGRCEPVPSMLDNIGGDLWTPAELKRYAMVSLLHWGNTYWQKIFNGAGALVAYNPVHPGCVLPQWDDTRPGGKRFDVTTNAYGPDGSVASTTRSFDPSTMTQIMGLSLDGLQGISPITAARMSLGTGLAGDKAAHRAFSNGALISGMVTPTDDDLGPDEAEQIKRDINTKVLGPDNAGDIPVINRKLQFSPWTMSAADAQFLESRRFQVIEVARWLGLPPHLLSDMENQSSWGSGVAEQNQGLSRYTLQPWTVQMEERISRDLNPGRRRAQFDYAKFVEPSAIDKTNLWNTRVNGGWATPNEARAAVGLPPTAGGDVLRTPPGAAPAAMPAAPGGPPIEGAAA